MLEFEFINKGEKILPSYYYILNVVADAKTRDDADILIGQIKCPNGVSISDVNQSEQNYEDDEIE